MTGLEKSQMPSNSKERPTTFDRRDVLKGIAFAVAAGAGAAGMAQAETGSDYPKAASSTGDTVRAAGNDPVVETRYGRVRGYVHNGIFSFKGMPYGADTSGPNRFMPPQKPAPWTGVRSSLSYGWVSPQPAREGWKNDEEAWLFRWNDGIANEDCLRLNLWSPGINDGRKRPVMVWLHGGGFSAGSGNELPSYDGENLARRGDVVLVSINHRLNILGHLNLAAFGDKYANSGNAGMLDIVAALEWVRDNIGQFGGDPGNVTIFGQSGGGGKVNTLMAMPSAKGLFHRAIVESGSLLAGATMESSNKLATAVLQQLQIAPSDVAKLHDLPVGALEEAGVEVLRRNRPVGGIIDFRHIAGRLGWSPVAGPESLPQQPFDPQAPAMSAAIPLLVGNTLNEFVNGINRPDAFQMTDAEMRSNVKKIWADKTDRLVDVFRKAYPHANNFQLWSAIAASPVRAATLEQVRRKAAQHSGPAYCYRFDWQTPILDGRPMAFHCSELAFVFDNTERCAAMTGNGAAARVLAAKMSEAWIHFARSGDPNHAGLPHWKPFDPATNGTMVFDNECAFREHLDDETQKMIDEA
jgi:para-nitrobenzyl esterase